MAISPQNLEANQGLRERRELPFPILADSEQAVIHEWGLFNDLDPQKRDIPYPAVYVVARNGRIAWSHLGIATRDRPSAGEVVAAFKREVNTIG